MDGIPIIGTIIINRLLHNTANFIVGSLMRRHIKHLCGI